jgi:hypothetical protein
VSNKYLEKIAETYSVKGHTGYGVRELRTPNVNLNKHEYHDYVKHKQENGSKTVLKHVAGGTAIGGVTGALVTSSRFVHGIKNKLAHKGKGALIGAAVGAAMGTHSGIQTAHDNALSNIGVSHPALSKKTDKGNK